MYPSLNPRHYKRCTRCGARAKAPCVALATTGSGIAGEAIRTIHAGRMRGSWSPPIARGRRIDPEVATRRLQVWRQRAILGDPVDDIAAELGLKRKTLEAYVVRARRKGHPLAIYHAKLSYGI